MTIPVAGFCLGAQKAGTTTLDRVLRPSKELSLPAIKETHYFARDTIYARGDEYYESLFSPQPGSRHQTFRS